MSYKKKTLRIDNTNKKYFFKMKNGNHKAFDTLFRKYYSILCRFSFTFVNNFSDAEEIVQIMFVNFWEAKHKIKINTSVKSYLFSSVKNTAFNFIKKRKIKKNHEKNYNLEKKTENIEKANWNKNKFENIYKKGVEKLPVKCRRIYYLSRNEGLTYNEIAEIERVSKKTVENQIGIALKKLREYMLPYLSEIMENN